MINRIVLTGRLVRDPELRYTSSGIPVCNMRIAVDRAFTRSDGERETDFIDIVAWRQSAEFSANYLSKGRLVAVDGRLQIREWEAQDGTRRRTAEVVADRIEGLDRPRGEEGGGPPATSEDAETPPAEPEPFSDPFADE